MITRRQMTGSTGAMLLTGLLAACVVSDSTYNQLNQRLSAEIATGQVHITRLQGAIKIAVNSELLFPSGGWQMPPQAAQTIAEMAPAEKDALSHRGRAFAACVGWLAARG